MELRAVLLSAMFMTLAHGAGGIAVTSTAISDDIKTMVAASSGDAIAIPRMLSYQGKLTDTAGRSVPDGVYAVDFRLFDVPTGGSFFWSELQSVTTRSGLFSVLLGSVTPVSDLPTSGDCYLEVQVIPDLPMSPRVRIVSSAYSFFAQRAETASVAARSGDNAWVRGTPDSVLYTVRNLGLARGGTSSMLHGANRFTHVNLGVACTTGASGLSRSYCTVGGGYGNTAGDRSATVAGGYGNAARDSSATVGGGSQNLANYYYSTVAGGSQNSANERGASVCGGRRNTAEGVSSTVSGGERNTASGPYAAVPGGYGNSVSGYASAAVGMYDTVDGMHSFAANTYSKVSAGNSNSVAFNGEAATSSGQLRCGILAKAGGSFSIDHPLEPGGRILNHYFVESPDMSNLYSGSVVLSGNGRAEVRLPEYFDVLNRNPRVQLTGVGSPDAVYVAEDVSGNRFAIGGKPGTKVYWLVTGDRKDQSAEIIRAMMPVEQPKTGALARRMLDDDLLASCLKQLEDMGRASEFHFSSAAARQRAEDSRSDRER